MINSQRGERSATLHRDVRIAAQQNIVNSGKIVLGHYEDAGSGCMSAGTNKIIVCGVPRSWTARRYPGVGQTVEPYDVNGAVRWHEKDIVEDRDISHRILQVYMGGDVDT